VEKIKSRNPKVLEKKKVENEDEDAEVHLKTWDAKNFESSSATSMSKSHENYKVK